MAAQQKEIKHLYEQINYMKKKRDYDQHNPNDRERWHDKKRVPTLCCGWTFSSAQKECLLLRTEEDDVQKGVGSQIDR